MNFKIRPIGKLPLDFTENRPPERIAITLWRNGRGRTIFIEGTQVNTTMKLLIKQYPELKDA